MRRFLLALCLFAVVGSGCAVGGPKPATYVTDISATLNGDAYSSIEGQLTYWFRYGEATSYGTETPRRTIENTETVAHQVSAPIQGLTSGTTYHWQMCVQDEEEDPPRAVCSKDQTFTTRATPGRSGILFTSTRYGADDLIYMTAAGADSAPLYRDPYSWDGAPEWSPDGQRIAFDRYGYDVGSEKVFVAKADGSNPANITDNNTINRAPAWSPDGTKIAFSAGTPDDDSPYEDIYVMSTDGSNRTRLTYDPEPDTYPSWSPDGTKIVFNSSRDTSHGQDEIYVMNADGSDVTRLTFNSARDLDPEWSPDGTRILFTSLANLGDTYAPGELYVIDPDGGNPTNLTNNTAVDAFATWSPDGQRIAFGSSRDGNSEIYTMNADGGNVVRLTNNTTYDGSPAWSPRP